MVGKRNEFEDPMVSGSIERGPPAIVVLHGQQPTDATLGGGGVARPAEAAQRHRDHRGVVHIRIPRIAILKPPAASLGRLIQIVGPITPVFALAVNQPAGGLP